MGICQSAENPHALNNYCNKSHDFQLYETGRIEVKFSQRTDNKIGKPNWGETVLFNRDYNFPIEIFWR